MKNEKAVQLKFYLLQVTHWCGFASMASFISAFMLSKGMSKTDLSIMVALYMFMAFLGQFFWGTLCDRYQANKKVFMAAEALVLLLYVLIYLFSDSFVLVYLLYSLLGFVLIPIASNLDSWILKCFAHKPEVYGPARGCSSIAFGLFMLFYGKLITGIGYQIMPFFAAGFIGLSLLTAATQPEAAQSGTSGDLRKMSIKDVGTLMKLPTYLLLILLLFILGLSLSPISNLKIVLLENVGGTVEHQGYDSFFGCMLQTPFFFLAAKLKKLPQNRRMLLSVLGVFLMIGIDLLAANPFVIIGADAFYFVAYAILLPTYREITEGIVPANIKTTAHGLCDAVFSSMAGMIALCYSGVIMDFFGIHTLLILCFVLVCLAIVMCMIFVRVNRKRSS